MIVEYHRPDNIAEALALLARQEPVTVPMGGGTTLSHTRKPDLAVVDLQCLGLDKIQSDGQWLKIGSAVTLQALLESELLPEGFRTTVCDCLTTEVGRNIRQTATVAGTLVSCDGRSPFLTALLALDARIIWAPGGVTQTLENYLSLRGNLATGRLITEVQIPLTPVLRYEQVARTQMDRPIICAALAVWPSGRTRVAVGGYGQVPVLVYDELEPGGAAAAASEACRTASDQWASAEYRSVTAGKLVERLLHG